MALLLVNLLRDERHVGPGSHRASLITVGNVAPVDDRRNPLTVKTDCLPVCCCELALQRLLSNARHMCQVHMFGEYPPRKRVVKEEAKGALKLFGLNGA
jgi:hypothetical protein